MPRVFIPPDAMQGQTILIKETGSVHHLVRVLRLRVGDRLECCDGTGRVYQGTVVQVTDRELRVAVEQSFNEPPSRPRVTLAQALIKPERFEWILEKSTELGVARLIPMMTSRTTIRLDAGAAGPRLTRWRRIIEAASAQCGRSTLPTLDAPQPFEQIVKEIQGASAVLPTLAEERVPLERHLPEIATASEAFLFIGPEGDFSPAELRTASQFGIRTASLGASTLRSETAALAALVLIQQASGRFFARQPSRVADSKTSRIVNG